MFSHSIMIPLIVLAISLYWGHRLNNTDLEIDDQSRSIDEHLEARRIEALKALADWSKWIITIQASFITLVTLKLGEDVTVGEIIPGVNLTILSFTLSIFSATMLLGSIPSALTSSKKYSSENVTQVIYQHPTALYLSIGAFAAAEHVLFLLGIIYIFVGLIFK